jgi:methionyl-tRNA formyltransferase
MNNASKKRVIFMGTPQYAESILQYLHEDDRFDIVLVLTQPDRPAGRKKIMTPPPVKIFAEMNSIDIMQPDKLNDPSIEKSLRQKDPDFIIVAAYGQILPKSILGIAPCINLHASLLPEYRGASPIQQAILNGDRYTGVSAMLMEQGLDSGPVLGYEYIEIGRDTGLKTLTATLTDMAAKLTPKILARFDQLMPVKQHGSSASICKKIKRSDGEVDMSSAIAVYGKYRAFEGWPGIYLPNGLKLKRIVLADEKGRHRPGEILLFEDESMIIGCLAGAVRVEMVQPSSKKEMTARSYAVGRGLEVGDSIF